MNWNLLFAKNYISKFLESYGILKDEYLGQWRKINPLAHIRLGRISNSS